MSQNVNTLPCAAFQSQLPELIGSRENIADNPHFQTCKNCRALLAELESIAEAARQLFPIEEPPDELWAQIEMAIVCEEANSNSR